MDVFCVPFTSVPFIYVPVVRNKITSGFFTGAGGGTDFNYGYTCFFYGFFYMKCRDFNFYDSSNQFDCEVWVLLIYKASYSHMVQAKVISSSR